MSEAGGAAAGPTYPPLDTLKRVAEDVFIVDAAFPGMLGRAFAIRMGVLRLPDAGLLLYSPTPPTDALRREIDALGTVRHLIAPSLAHWMFLGAWQLLYPAATSWAAPGLRDRGTVRRAGLRLDHDLSDTAPAEWGEAVETVVVPGGGGFHEVALLHRPSRTLLLADLVQNIEQSRLPAVLRPLARLLGVVAPDGMAPVYLRALVNRRRADAASAAARLVGLGPERVIFAHGRWFERDGTAALRRSLRWLSASGAAGA